MALLLLLLFTISQFLLPASCSPPPSSSICDWCPRQSTAALLPPASAADLSDGGGACGYGATMAIELNGGGGHFAAAAGAEFFRDGAGCGACYQLRCRDRRVCGGDGVKVVVTDAANRTGFLLTREAFAAMARHGMADQLAAGALGNDNVQIDFRRVPCEYKKNLAVRVEEDGSRHPNQLVVRFLYQGGQTDIAAVEIAQAANHTTIQTSWRPMARLRLRTRSRRRGGVVWRATSAPGGPLQLRVVVTAGVGGKWLRAGEAVVPAEWRPGQVYDTGLRVTDVALQTCTRSCRARAGGGGGNVEELR